PANLSGLYRHATLSVVTPIPERWRGTYRLELPVHARAVTLEQALVASPSSLNFGSLEPGQHATRSVTFTNISNLPISVESVAIGGSAASTYTVTDSSCEGLTL